MENYIIKTYNEDEEKEEGMLLYICARKGSGKTYLIVQLLACEDLYADKFDKIYFFCPSFYEDPKYACLDIPHNQVFEKFNAKKVETIMKNKNKSDHILLVFDDCITDEDFKQNQSDNILNTIAVNGRHLGMSMIVSSQKTTGASTFIRSQADGVILFKPRSMNEKEAIYMDNCIAGLDKKEFFNLIDYATKEKHSFLYINYQNDTVWKNYNLITL